MNSLEVTNQIKIDNAMPLTVRVLPNNRLIMGYINAFWKFDLQKALSSPEARPNRRTWVFPGYADSDLKGKLFFDEKYVYGCMRTLHTGIFNDVHPFVFNLDDLKLN